MSLKFDIDTARKLIVGKATGMISHEDLEEIVDQMVKHPEYDSSFNEIWDIREVDKVETFFEQTDNRIDKEKEIRGIQKPNREAIVVSNVLQYGTARQYAILAEKIPLFVEVFYDYEKALQWGLEE